MHHLINKTLFVCLQYMFASFFSVHWNSCNVILLCTLEVIQPLQSDEFCPGHSKWLICLVSQCALCHVRQKKSIYKYHRVFSVNLFARKIYSVVLILYESYCTVFTKGDIELCNMNSQEQHKCSQWKTENFYFVRLNLLEWVFKVDYKTSEFWA